MTKIFHLLKFKSHTLKHSKAKGEITRSKAYLELNRIKDTIKNFRLPLKLYLEGNLQSKEQSDKNYGKKQIN